MIVTVCNIAVDELMTDRCDDCPVAPEAGSHAQTRHTYTQGHMKTKGRGGDTRTK